ncbi:MAG: polysaccharide export protein [Alphaproteobacteria bacterium]|nr:polysaccharide export protein [Alphaproteobacteria bacterium]
MCTLVPPGVSAALAGAPAPGAPAVPAGAPTPSEARGTSDVNALSYRISAGDQLQIFVWKNPDLSVEVPVRPDGKISTPLVSDIDALGRTPTELATALRKELSNYIKDPVVTVMVKGFAAPTSASAIRVIGAAVKPQTVSYHAGITALDVLIQVGGLTNFADGNDAELIRAQNGSFKTFPLHLTDLLQTGNMKDNIKLMPGDVLRIPERWF